MSWQAIEQQHGGTLWRIRHGSRYVYAMTADKFTGNYRDRTYQSEPVQPIGTFRVFNRKSDARLAFIARV